MMTHVLAVGGGLAGCTAALELADQGIQVTLLEKAERIGGKVRNFGCKATDRCNNCGLCLAGRLWDRVENHSRIKIRTHTDLADISGKKGSFKAWIKTIGRSGQFEAIEEIGAIIVSIGYDRFSSLSAGNLAMDRSLNIISAYQMEEILRCRSKDGILPVKPSAVAFIQCFGSRDIQEKALYCSRVCCGYSTRTARVLRQFYPDARIVFFYMDLQEVETGEYFQALTHENIEFIRCRPVRTAPADPPGESSPPRVGSAAGTGSTVSVESPTGAGKPVKILYEEPETGKVTGMQFDLVVLSEGIHPPSDAGRLAEICILGLDGNGFLKAAGKSSETGIYLAGCASGPKGISETYADALTVARTIINGGSR